MAVGAQKKDFDLAIQAAADKGLVSPDAELFRTLFDKALANPDLRYADWAALAEVTRQQQCLARVNALEAPTFLSWRIVTPHWQLAELPARRRMWARWTNRFRACARILPTRPGRTVRSGGT